MSRIYIIARLEFIKFVTRRGFLFTLIGVPIWIALVSIVPVMLAPGDGQAVFTVIDSSHIFQPEIATRLAREDAQRDLVALADYAAAHADLAALKHAAPQTFDMLADPSRYSAVAAFQRAGGWHAVFATLSTYLKPGSPTFNPPVPPLVLVDPPADLVAAPPQKFAPIARSYLKGERVALDAVVVVPRDFAGGGAEFWTVHPQAKLQAFVQSALTDALRLRAAHRLGDAKASAALDIEADVTSRDPSSGDPGNVAAVASVSVAVGMAILLLVVSIMNSMALLQGVVEEKSTRMIEVLLSSATPWEIVGGKIAGVVAVALFTVCLWVGSAILLATIFAGQGANTLIVASLHAIADPTLLPLIVLYFLCGLLTYGAIFLSIGSMSASLADAQAYLGPSMMIIMLPNLFIAAILRAPNGTLATMVSYVPVYTPYIMLLRVGSHPPVIQLVTTALFAVAVTAFLVWKAGDIFARHALTTERPPALRTLFAGLRRRFSAK